MIYGDDQPAPKGRSGFSIFSSLSTPKEYHLCAVKISPVFVTAFANILGLFTYSWPPDALTPADFGYILANL